MGFLMAQTNLERVLSGTPGSPTVRDGQMKFTFLTSTKVTRKLAIARSADVQQKHTHVIDVAIILCRSLVLPYSERD